MTLDLAIEAPNFSGQEDLKPWWHMRPGTGIWWADILWLVIIFALNQHILPSIFGTHIPIDLVTPWLVVSFVVGSPFQVVLIWFIGSMLLETSTTAPKGTFLCAYWIVLSALLLARKTLSWKLVVPWLVTFFVSSFWISNFETLIIFLKQDPAQLNFGYFFSQLVRVLLACIVGMAIAQPWMYRFKGDRIKGDRLKGERVTP